jgi:BirA family biotin operon repressor/biotin-[acetyl-CoA-carboxylase] ligase
VFGDRLVHLASCGSTNDEAAQLARDGAAHGTVVIADSQRTGRGRDGRAWASPHATGLYLSIVLRPTLALPQVPPLTLALGIATCDAAREVGAAARLKWPNDVLVGMRKLAGILVETQSRGDRLDAVIAGIGVNVRGGDLPGTATSIADAAPGAALSPRDFATILLRHVEHWHDRYVAAVNAPQPDGLAAIVPAWRDRMATGLAVRAADVTGVAIGLDRDGSLLVQDASGATHRVRSGDVAMIAGRAPA